ncbi:MAG: site-specific DNA-methyltransferase [Gammaproteobacteria bacterium]|nr:site-specific DNA-methyltransferase [Gammaproteobacteria bacterium]
MPTLQFKGKVFVENHHLAVPFHELLPVRDKGLSEKASLHDNLIVEGDNLASLKALLPTYHGKVKCIYIDPPYNTGNEGWAYNDNVNSPMMQDWLGKVVDRDDLTRHDKWCCMMLPRLKLLRELLRDDGAIFVSIDDNEVHHLRSLMDEVFGEENFVATIIWEKVYSPKSSAKYLSENHDFIVAYARNKGDFKPGLLPRTAEADARYNNPDNDPRGPWKPSDLSARNPYSKGLYEITCPGGRVVSGPPPGNYWRYSEEKFRDLDKDNRIWWGEDKNQVPAIKRFLSEVKQGLVPETIWTYKEVSHTQGAKKTLLQIFPENFPDFTTVKPVELLSRIIMLSTDKDSIVLDSFAGSGTTAHAVLALNKKDGGNRRFVLIECEGYVDSITSERVRRVIKGVPSAREEALKSGLGGSFSYFELGRPMRQESLLDGSNLPGYEKLASYVFFTATGEEFLPEHVRRDDWFIGSSRLYDVFLIYEPEVKTLKNMALTLDMARSLPSAQRNRNRLVFAPTKYLDREFLHKYRITFQQLPFQIYEAVDNLSTVSAPHAGP